MLMTVLMTVAVTMAMTMTMPARVRPGFGLERGLFLRHDQVHALQHLGQHMIGFDLQVVGLEFDLHMPVAQVIGRACQVEGRAMLRTGPHQQHRLRRSFNPHQRAVLGHQHIAAAHHRAAWQEDAQGAAQGIRGVEAALLARVPVKADAGGALEEHGGQAAPGGHEFVDGEHETTEDVMVGKCRGGRVAGLYERWPATWSASGAT